jgi:hypothetical protein
MNEQRSLKLRRVLLIILLLMCICFAVINYLEIKEVVNLPQETVLIIVGAPFIITGIMGLLNNTVQIGNPTALKFGDKSKAGKVINIIIMVVGTTGVVLGIIFLFSK